MHEYETLTHRLVLPEDSNHYGTLYAGALLRLSLEAAYASAYRMVGPEANLVLRRVLNVECHYPVPMGQVVEIRGAPLHLTRAYMVIGLIGSPLKTRSSPWMDGLMGFVQVDKSGRPSPFPEDLSIPLEFGEDWIALKTRLDKLLHLR